MSSLVLRPLSLIPFSNKRDESALEKFNITVIQAFAPTNNVEEAEVEQFYEDL